MTATDDDPLRSLAFFQQAAIPKLLARFDGIVAGPGDLPDVVRLRFGSWDVDLFVIRDDDAETVDALTTLDDDEIVRRILGR